MAKLKIMSVPYGRSENNSSEMKIVIKLSHKGDRKFIDTGVRLLKNQFIENDKTVVNHPRKEFLNHQISNKFSDCLNNLTKISGKVDDLDIEAVYKFITQPKKEDAEALESGANFFDGIESYIQMLRRRGQNKTACTYEYTRDRLKDYWQIEFLDYKTMRPEFLEEFRTWMKAERGFSHNTMSIIERCIRTVFNREITLEHIPESCYPFRKHKALSSTRSMHKDIVVEKMRAIRDLDLMKISKRKNPALERARDLFMLSFYMVGMNLKDLWDLEESDDEGDEGLRLFRSKTGKPFVYVIPPEAVPIIERYKGKGIQPLYKGRDGALLSFRKKIKVYDSLLHSVNDELKKIGKHDTVMIEDLTFYYARHSWATIAADQLGYSTSDISTALGHSDAKVKVTERYVKDSGLRRAKMNREVLDFLNKGTTLSLKALSEGSLYQLKTQTLNESSEPGRRQEDL